MTWSRLTGRRPQTSGAWLARLQSRDLSSAERAQFQRWLEADLGNQEEFRRAEQLWQRLKCVASDEQLVAETRRALTQSLPTRTRLASLGRWSAVAAALVFAVFGIWWAVGLAGVRDVQTAVGEQRKIELADGSRVTLNTASKMRIDYRFGHRRIRLERGEALFDVAHDATHPFVVQTGLTVVTALGTEFAVTKSAEGVEVSVLEGRVRADVPRAGEHSFSSIVLAAGQAGHLASREGQWIRGEADLALIRAWQAARLQFQNATLETVVAEFNRYSTTQLVLEDRRLAPLPVSGVFRIGQTESLVRALVEVYPIRAHREANRILLRFASSPVTPTRYIVDNEEPRAAPRGHSRAHESGTSQ